MHLTSHCPAPAAEVVRKLRLPRMTIKSAVDIDLVRRSRRGQQAEKDREEESSRSLRGAPAKANASKAQPAAAPGMVLESTEDEVLELEGIPAVPGRTFSYSSGKAGSGTAVAPSGGSGSSKKEAWGSSDAQQQQAGAEEVGAEEDISASDKGRSWCGWVAEMDSRHHVWPANCCMAVCGDPSHSVVLTTCAVHGNLTGCLAACCKQAWVWRTLQ